MGQCEAQVFTGITAGLFAKLSEKARVAGIPIEGASGEATRMGIHFSWKYEEAEGKLTIQCIHVPFFVSCNDVNQRVAGVMRETLDEG